MTSRILLALAAFAIAPPAWAQTIPEVMVSRADRAAFPAGHGTVDVTVRFTPEGVVKDCAGGKAKAPTAEASCRLLRERGWFGSTRERNAEGVEKVRFNWDWPPAPNPDIVDGGAAMISPALWVRDDDYPADALDREGTTVVELDVSDLGAITRCAVVKSSGSHSLDLTTCRIFVSRGRYFPAGDGAGGRKATRARMVMNWLRS